MSLQDASAKALNMKTVDNSIGQNGDSRATVTGIYANNVEKSILAGEVNAHRDININSRDTRATNSHYISAQNGNVHIMGGVTYKSENNHHYHRTEAKQMFTWLQKLSTLDFWEEWRYHIEVLDQIPDSGTWILKHECFEEFNRSNNGSLWCQGQPGCGKTYLSSVILNHIKQQSMAQSQDDHRPRTYASVFFDHQQRAKQNAVNILMNILSQIIRKSDQCSQNITDIFDRYQENQTVPSVPELVCLIQAEMKQFHQVYLILDGLDQCPNEDNNHGKETLIGAICKLKGYAKIIYTSRPDTKTFELLNPDRKLEVCATEEDLTRYVLHHLGKPDRKGSGAQISYKTIVANSQGSFLLARMCLDVATAQSQVNSEPYDTNYLPKTHQDFYKTELLRLTRSSKGDEALEIFSWVYFAARPLTVWELLDAVECRFAEKPLAREVLDFLTGGLVLTNKSGNVSLFHQTMREFLKSNYFIDAHVYHQRLASRCLATLSSFQCIEAGTKRSCTLRPELLNYAADHWAYHVQRAGTRSEAWETAVSFLSNPENVRQTHKLMTNSRVPGEDQISGLHLAVFFGIQRLVKMVAKSRPEDLHATTVLGRTPLHWATMLRQHKIVEVLLQNGANPNAQDSRHRTPLHYCISISEKAIAQTILQTAQGLDCNIQDYSGFTPLRLAARHNIEWAIPLLLPKVADDINDECSDGFTALRWAAKNGNRSMIIELIKWKASVVLNKAGDWSLLYFAASEPNYVDLMKLLIYQKVNVNQIASKGMTALQVAIQHRHKAIVYILLEAGADVNGLDEEGLPSLHYIIRQWNDYSEQSILWLLLHKGADVNQKDRQGRTALHHALELNHISVIWLLLERKADSNIGDLDGRTPLHLALQTRHVAGAMLLCQLQANIDCNVQDEAGQTPLHVAVYNHIEEVIAPLIQIGADPNIQDHHGLSPLHVAAIQPSISILQKLVACKANMEAKDPRGRTALHRAVNNNNYDAVRFLLKEGANPMICDNEGKNTLHLSINKRHVKIALDLVEHVPLVGYVNTMDDTGNTPLHYAAQIGDRGLIIRLRRRHRNYEICNKNGETPLDIAKRSGHATEPWTCVV